jgi:hypothetical protein
MMLVDPPLETTMWSSSLMPMSFPAASIFSVNLPDQTLIRWRPKSKISQFAYSLATNASPAAVGLAV